MQITLLKAKIHRATVTQCDLHYEGSITVDADLMARAGLFPHEQVDVLNINTGARFTTYVIAGAAGSGIIGINGAAARLAQKGDLVIICAYCALPAEAAPAHAPTIVLMGHGNAPISVTSGADGR
ncbi:MAG TPA: aspartate 1-decarboxylase [Rhodospirillaceae bacterium]|jgi:aspartate 1-decarboxylase|nr:aspartate 1-decarboxylase [Alphaproteobacteria bacterium]HBH26629.1 aspartate 1-decarboxylase [Rhodospirillaceae bacterium]